VEMAIGYYLQPPTGKANERKKYDTVIKDIKNNRSIEI
jgi:hypothetical protein